VQRTASTAECIESVRRIQKRLASNQIRALAKDAHPSWMLSLAIHIDDTAPSAADLIERLSSRQDLTGERDYAVQLIQELRQLSLNLRAAAGQAAIPLTSTLHLHYLNTTPSLDLIATVTSSDVRTAHAMYLLSAILRDPMGTYRWLPSWVDRQMPQRAGGWGRLLGGTPPGREELEKFAQDVVSLAPRLLGPPRDILVAGLGDPPEGLP
jgi:hypothetical protein